MPDSSTDDDVNFGAGPNLNPDPSKISKGRAPESAKPSLSGDISKWYLSGLSNRQQRNSKWSATHHFQSTDSALQQITYGDVGPRHGMLDLPRLSISSTGGANVD